MEWSGLVGTRKGSGQPGSNNIQGSRSIIPPDGEEHLQPIGDSGLALDEDIVRPI
jgi:hypothetical protein